MLVLATFVASADGLLGNEAQSVSQNLSGRIMLDCFQMINAASVAAGAMKLLLHILLKCPGTAHYQEVSHHGLSALTP